SQRNAASPALAGTGDGFPCRHQSMRETSALKTTSFFSLSTGQPPLRPSACPSRPDDTTIPPSRLAGIRAFMIDSPPALPGRPPRISRMKISDTARTGGQILVDALRVHGVDLAFGVPVESYLEVLDALHG